MTNNNCHEQGSMITKGTVAKEKQPKEHQDNASLPHRKATAGSYILGKRVENRDTTIEKSMSMQQSNQISKTNRLMFVNFMI